MFKGQRQYINPVDDACNLDDLDELIDLIGKIPVEFAERSDVICELVVKDETEKPWLSKDRLEELAEKFKSEVPEYYKDYIE